MSGIAEAAPASRVLLVGMMGAGKSSVGKALSQATGWPYLDNDDLVAAATGRHITQVLAEAGEKALRDAESAALGHALSLDPPLVAGIAGGVVLDPSDRVRLAGGGFVVWLRARVETLARRVGTGQGRPWLQPDPVAALRRLAADREPHYAAVARLVVDVDDVGADEAARRVLDALRVP